MDTNKHESIVDKIKKLLRLGESSNVHEAELALARAYEIAAKHQIDLADIELNDESDELMHRSFQVGLRISLLKRKAIAIVINFFNVSGFRSGDQVTFIGAESDIAIAWYVFELVVSECKRRLREYEHAERRLGGRFTNKKRDSFIVGFIYGLAASLGRRREQLIIEDSRFAIVISSQDKARDAYMHTVNPDIGPARIGRKIKDPNKSALIFGYQHGRDTRIRMPLNNQAGPRQTIKHQTSNLEHSSYA